MRSRRAVSFLVFIGCSSVAAQSPFQFREAYLLEHRIEVTRSGEEYDPHHSEVWLSTEGPSPTNRMVADRNDPNIYRAERWKELPEQTDRYRRMGGLALAEQEYQDMIAKLRVAQGANSDNVALLLDHLGEFYLEARSFDKAYKAFSDALEVRKATIAALPATAATATAGPEFVAYHTFRLHLGDLETRLGEMDLAKGDLKRAGERLTDSVAIANEPVHQRFVFGLYAVYFESLVLERQQKWAEAEALWTNAVSVRAKLFLSEPYWNALKEQAAFYARKGDFHAAAAIAQQVATGTAGKTMKPELPMPYLDSRPRAVVNQPQYSLYGIESNVAMSEILAMDKWRTDGPDAAAPLLKDLFVPQVRDTIDRGSDSERTQLLKWFEQRVFLHMSILLDGEPTQERIDKAYETLSQVKGAYLSTFGTLTRMYETDRANPNNQMAQFLELDQLAKAREEHPHLFVESALDGKPVDEVALAARENAEQVLASALLAGPSSSYAYTYFPRGGVANAVPANSAFVDIVVWERSDREGKRPPQREYGAFVMRRGEPTHYVRLGAADAIDRDIDALRAGVLGGRQRGLQVEVPQQAAGATDVEPRLKSLYHEVMAPLIARVGDAKTLYIVPDGKLTMAPISAFEDDQGRFAFQSRTIMYLQSWRDLSTSTVFDRLKPSAPVIVANPDFDLAFHAGDTAKVVAGRPLFRSLPGAEGEAGDIAQLLKVSQERVLTGKAARQWLIESLRSPEILHFATHSVPHFAWTPPGAGYSLFEFPSSLEMQYPLLESMIALAGANRTQDSPEDGVLTGLEVGSLHLGGTKLVVLSSCESGQGTAVDGQGVLGLRAAFAMAGAESMVMTLWPVDDAAGRQFMRFFYAHVKDGPAEAVREAQEEMLTKTEYKNPFYWSGYVVSGSPLREEMDADKRMRPPVEAPKPPGQEVFVTPNCFDFATRDGATTGYSQRSAIRVRIGGVANKSEVGPGQVDYALTTGSDVEVHSSMSVNGGPPISDPEVEVASERNWDVDFIVSRQKDASAVTIRFGPHGAEPDKQRHITLSGGPNLFPSFDVPETLPALKSYTRASYDWGTSQSVQRLGFCGDGAAAISH